MKFRIYFRPLSNNPDRYLAINPFFFFFFLNNHFKTLLLKILRCKNKSIRELLIDGGGTWIALILPLSFCFCSWQDPQALLMTGDPLVCAATLLCIQQLEKLLLPPWKTYFFFTVATLLHAVGSTAIREPLPCGINPWATLNKVLYTHIKQEYSCTPLHDT